jgi:hypothetical protein
MTEICLGKKEQNTLSSLNAGDAIMSLYKRHIGFPNSYNPIYSTDACKNYTHAPGWSK